MVAYLPLLLQLLELFKYIVYVMIFLCCIKYLRK